ncbi:helix-turn-helix domain-containing protein [Sphingobium sp. B2]|uniref:helix-turn-helix domain-containing protein n=1 Tax=Sphingobium sp. B2 TaxID=2583228 RepID=UPI00119D0945|nr:hypothetical protein [Sphingobium sp. B2]
MVFPKDELVPAFAFYLVSDEGEPSMRLVDVPDVDAAKTWAMDAIRSASLHTIRFWDGVRVIEVKRPAMRQPRKKPGDAEERGKRMIAMKAKGMKQREIAAAFGISIGRVRDVMAREELRAEEAIQTNRAALSGRANNVLRHLVIEPEADPAERDRLLPERVATLTRREIMNLGNSGKVTLAEIEAWLWERGRCLSPDV